MIGVDIVNIKRIEKLIEKFGKKALEKFLDNDEIEIAKSTQTIAGFWAAKEAIAKALELGISKECSFFDIKIYKLPNGSPNFTLSSRLVKKFKITSTSLSITHDNGFAIAVATIKSKKKAKKKVSH